MSTSVPSTSRMAAGGIRHSYPRRSRLKVSPGFPSQRVMGFRKPAAMLAAALIILLGPASAAACRGAGATTKTATKRTLVRATLCILNAKRAGHDLRPLRLNAKLGTAARRHSRAMVRERFFSHDLAERGHVRRPYPRRGLPGGRSELDRRGEHRLRVWQPLDAALDRARVDEQPWAPGEHPERGVPLDRDRDRVRHAGPGRGRHLHHRFRTAGLGASATRPQRVPRPPRRGRTRGCPRSGRARPPRPLAERRAMERCPRRAPAALRRS